MSVSSSAPPGFPNRRGCGTSDVLHLDILPERARRVLDLLAGQAFWERFYLAGGTGLALQIGHRLSADFDLFSPSETLGAARRQELIGSLSALGRVRVDREEERTLRLTLEEVPLSFFHYPYALLHPPEAVEGLRIASIEDIGLMKLAAIVSRGTRRDFVDLYAIVSEAIRLRRLLEGAAQKFPQVRDFAIQSLRALVYFQDAEAEAMPRLVTPVDWETVKTFFVDEVTRLSREWITSD